MFMIFASQSFKWVLLIAIFMLFPLTSPARYVEALPVSGNYLPSDENFDYAKDYFGLGTPPSDVPFFLSNGRGWIKVAEDLSSNPGSDLSADTLDEVFVPKTLARQIQFKYVLDGHKLTLSDHQRGSKLRFTPMSGVYTFRVDPTNLNFTIYVFFPENYDAYVIIINAKNTNTESIRPYWYVSTDTCIIEENWNRVEWDPENQVFVAYNTNQPLSPFMVFGSDLPCVGHNATTKNDIWDRLSSSNPLPSDFNTTTATGSLVSWLVYRPTIYPNQAVNMTFVYAWSGKNGTKQYAIDQYNSVKNNVASLYSRTLNSWKDYLSSTTNFWTRNATLDLAFYWSKVITKMSSWKKGLLTLGWGGYWPTDGLSGALGALTIGDFPIATKVIRYFADVQRKDGGISDIFDAVLFWTEACYQYYLYTGDTTFWSELVPRIKKAYNWILGHYNSSIGLIDCRYQGGVYREYPEMLTSSNDAMYRWVRPYPARFILMAQCLAYFALMRGYALFGNNTYGQYASYIKQNVETKMWNESTKRYDGFLDQRGINSHPDKFSVWENLAVFVFGLGDNATRRDFIYQQLIESHNISTPDHGPGTVSTIDWPAMIFYPAWKIPEECDMKEKASNYTFQNGGSFIGGGYMVPLFLANISKPRAYDALFRMAWMAAKTMPFAFAEWNDPIDGIARGSKQHIFPAGAFQQSMLRSFGISAAERGLKVDCLLPVSKVAGARMENFRYKNLHFDVLWTEDGYRFRSLGSGAYELSIEMEIEHPTQLIVVSRDEKQYSDWSWNATTKTLTIRNLEGATTIDVRKSTSGDLMFYLFLVGAILAAVVTVGLFLTHRKKMNTREDLRQFRFCETER